MTASSTLPAPNLMPLMRYRDLAEAMSWLEDAFGFEKQIAVSDSDGEVIYGQMSYRGSLMMMGAVRDTDLDKLMRQPDEVGGVETQSCYIVVDDADTHYARARDKGAEIVLEIKSDGLGRRGYSCRDPQGHIWNFGTYNPGKGLTMTSASAPPSVEALPEPPRRRHSPRVLMSIAGLMVALGATCWVFADEIKSDLSKRLADAAGRHQAAEAERAYAELVKVRAEKRKADELAQSLNSDLASERARRIATEADAGKTSERLSEEQTARRSAETAIAALREELKREQDALDAAVEAKRISEEKLAVKSATNEPSPPKQQAEVKAAEPPVAEAAPEAPAAPVALNAPAATPPEAPSSVATPAGASGIETSATNPASEKAAEQASAKAHAAASDDDDTATPHAAAPDREQSSARRASKSSQKSQKQATARASRVLPTYVVDLHDVPWPYNTWYK